jgi:hypothetical protein
VVLRAFDAAGGTIEGGMNETLRVDLNDDGYERAQKYGLVYTTMLPLKKPGPYQVRAACRDESSGNIGTGGDFVSIPKPKEKGIQLSGIVFQRALGSDERLVPASGPSSYAPGESAKFAVQVVPGRASSFRPERLALRVHLFRDGVDVWKSELIAVGEGSRELGRKEPLFLAHGSIDIPMGLEPGTYLARVDLSEVNETNALLAWQWAKLTIASPAH